MKTVFIVNPKAGQGKNIDRLISDIKSVSAELNADTEIYITQAVGDAKVYVMDYCNTIGPARFIACGGDGTLSEVLNGAIDCPMAEIGVVPMGTGNDFCRNFENRESFKNIALQIMGETTKCDAIKYKTETSEGFSEGYCVNMFNVGFDCNVAVMTGEMKKKPFISGHMAYLASILVNILKKKGADLRVEIDGEVKHEGPLLLNPIANGSYCGGGIKSNPYASVQDGYLSVNIIRDVSQLGICRLLPHYMKGTHMEIKGIEKIISTYKCKNVVITPLKGEIIISPDGEELKAGRTEFDIVHAAFNFVIPSRVMHGEALHNNT